MWYIGQEVVCIEEDSQFHGKVYTVLGIKPCCNEVSLEIYEPRCHNTFCHRCKAHMGGQFFHEDTFAPLDTLMKEEIKELVQYDEIYGVKLSEL